MTHDPESTVDLEVLYLDGQTCDPCRATHDAVDRAAEVLAGHLRPQGRTLAVRRTHVTDREQAERRGFVSSPTVRVDGVDIELDVREQHCGSCSALAGRDVDCRTFAWRGERHTSPPAEMIVERVLDHLAGRARPAARAPGRATGVERFLAGRADGRARPAPDDRVTDDRVTGDRGRAPGRR